MNEKQKITRLELALALLEEVDAFDSKTQAARMHIQDVLEDMQGANRPENYPPSQTSEESL
jgi:hypothetical protein